MLSAIFWRTIIVHCAVWVMSGVEGQAPCSLNDVPLMQDFNITKFLGRWYEVQWISPTYQDSGNAWSNYFHEYKADDFRVVTGYYSGKDPKTGECFLGGLVNMKTKEHQAKMLQYSENGKKMHDYWVLDTDYTNYAVVYSCLDKAGDANNTCNTARSWLWGRSTSLQNATVDRAITTFQNLCMNMTLLYKTEFVGENCLPSNTSDCLPSQTSDSSTPVAMASITTMLLLSASVLAFSKPGW